MDRIRTNNSVILPARPTAPRFWAMVMWLITGLTVAYVFGVTTNWGGSRFGSAIANVLLIPAGGTAAVFAWKAALRQGRGTTRRAWFLLSLAFAAFLAGDTLYFVYENVLGVTPYPSLADVCYLAFYPLLFAGLLSFPNTFPDCLRKLSFLLDAIIVVVGGGMLISYLLLLPTVSSSEESLALTLLSAGYPLGDLLMLAGVAYLLLRRIPQAKRWSAVLLSAGLIVGLVADVVFGYQSLMGAETHGLSDVGYMVSWGLYAWAGYAEFAGPVAQDRVVEDHATNWAAMMLPYAAIFLGFGLLLHVTRDSLGTAQGFVTISAVVLTLIVVARQVLALFENGRLQALRASRQSEERFRSLVTNASDAIFVTNSDTSITYTTPSVAGVLGYSNEDLCGRCMTDLVHPDDLPHVITLIAEALAEPGKSVRAHWRIRDPQGIWRDTETVVANLLDDPHVGSLVFTSRDIGERIHFERELEHQAFHDSLTGLANRALFRNRVQHSLESATRTGYPTTVIFLDLDDFKLVNDSLGHVIGDGLLIQVARRLESAIRPTDTAARLGGDEFAVLIDDLPSTWQAGLIARRMSHIFDEPFFLDSVETTVTASLGIAACEGSDATAEELLRDADVAMYSAKAHGKNRLEVFEASMQAAVRDRLALETDLRKGIERHEFLVHYQPIVQISTQRIVGTEALVRWQHPTRGLVMPGEFIPAAEETGLITAIGYQVLKEACLQAKAWEALAPDRAFVMNVNLSPRQIRDPRLTDYVAECLAESQLDPERLQLEITETVLLEDGYSTRSKLQDLKQLGVRLTIDDFGTGYSSLSYLHQFPVDGVKIAKPFIDSVSDGAEQSALARAIIGLGQTLHLEVVAEGIERGEQMETLREMGCELGQGYFSHRPLAPECVTGLLLRSDVPETSKPAVVG